MSDEKYIPKILPCHCKHAFQDERYGSGMRLHNQATKVYRCTVCSKEKSK